MIDAFQKRQAKEFLRKWIENPKERHAAKPDYTVYAQKERLGKATEEEWQEIKQKILVDEAFNIYNTKEKFHYFLVHEVKIVGQECLDNELNKKLFKVTSEALDLPIENYVNLGMLESESPGKDVARNSGKTNAEKASYSS